ncbi:MAG: hypothetical protein ABFD89_22075 [Bryobacteraceae bacterium]
MPQKLGETKSKSEQRKPGQDWACDLSPEERWEMRRDMLLERVEQLLAEKQNRQSRRGEGGKGKTEP